MAYLRFYKNTIPQEHDVVYVRTLQDNGETFDVEVLDYGGITGCISLSNMTRRTKNKEYKKIGLEYPAVVLISDDRGLMLSKSKVQRDDKDKHQENYEMAKKIMEYGNILSKFYKCYLEKNELPIDENMHNDVMEHSIWKYYDSLDGKSLNKDNLSYITSNFGALVNDSFFSIDFQHNFESFLSTRIKTTLMEMRTLMEIKCYASDAIQEIKNLFSTNYNDTYEFEICAKMQSPPVYSLTITGHDKDSMETYLDQCIVDIKQKVNSSHTNFKLLDEKQITRAKTITLVSFSIREVEKHFT